MPIDSKTWDVLLGTLDTVTETLPGTDPEDLLALRDSLEGCLDAVEAAIREQQRTA